MSSQSFAHLRFERLQHVFFRPSRPLLGAALDVARDARSPAEAWEAMASRGIIPADWAPHETRCFVPDGDGGVVALGGCPPTIAACVAFASDVAGVLTAEALAWELVSRLEPWGIPRPKRVCWRVGSRAHQVSLRAAGFGPMVDTLHRLVGLWSGSPREARYAHRDRSARRRAERAALRADRRARRDALLMGGAPSQLGSLAAELSHLLALWDFARREHLHISRMARVAGAFPYGLIGTRVASMRSPIDPLLSLYALGYGLGEITLETVTLSAVEVALE